MFDNFNAEQNVKSTSLPSLPPVFITLHTGADGEKLLLNANLIIDVSKETWGNGSRIRCINDVYTVNDSVEQVKEKLAEVFKMTYT